MNQQTEQFVMRLIKKSNSNMVYSIFKMKKYINNNKIYSKTLINLFLFNQKIINKLINRRRSCLKNHKLKVAEMKLIKSCYNIKIINK